MEIVDIGTMFTEAGIDEKTIFYGMEEIISNLLVWNIFAAIMRLSQPVVQFYRLPPDKIQVSSRGLSGNICKEQGHTPGPATLRRCRRYRITAFSGTGTYSRLDTY